MGFIKLSVKRNLGQQSQSDVAAALQTDIWAIFRALRESRCQYGLRPAHLQTLQAMLSFLKPGQGDTVFASNTEICRRVGGIDERTLRRHIDRFVELGFMMRCDSPNRKRYRIRSSDGQCISYGLSLTPLIRRADELLAVAQEIENKRRDKLFLRKQILTALAQIEQACPDSSTPSNIRKTLRRKLSISEYRALLTQAQELSAQMSTVVDMPETEDLSARNGQTDRHLSKSEERSKDSDAHESSKYPDIRTLTSLCDQALAFATQRLETWQDIESHARLLAPMMGIHPASFEKAIIAIGSRKASCAIFLTLQLGRHVRNFGAYFQSITLGRRVQQFDPVRILLRLSKSEPAFA